MTSLELDLRSVTGFLVADARGRVIGRVESPMYGSQPDVPDALAVRGGFMRGRRLVPAEAIGEIDTGSRVIGLSVVREQIRKVPLERIPQRRSGHNGRLRPRPSAKRFAGSLREPAIGRRVSAATRLAPQPSLDYALFRRSRLQNCQIAVELPLRELDAVLVPLLAA